MHSVRLHHWLIVSLVPLAVLTAGAAHSGGESAEVFPGVKRFESPVNLFTHNAQQHATVAVDAWGGVIAVWESRRQELGSSGIFARRLDPVGRPIGGEIHINQTLKDQQVTPAVATGPGGEVWFVWESYNQDGSQGSIVAREFTVLHDGTLTPVSNEMLVNQTREGHQSHPTVAVNAFGDVFFAWVCAAGETPAVVGRARLAGGILTQETRLGAGDCGRESQIAVASLATGEFVAVWAETDAEYRPTDVVVRRVSRDGAPLGAPLAVNAADSRMHIEPAVAADASGNFVVAWLGWNERNGAYDVLARRFSAAARPLGEPILVETGPQWRSGATVAMHPDGRFMIGFNREHDGAADTSRDARPSRRPTPSNLYARRYLASGAADGYAERVNDRQVGRQALRSGANGAQSFWTADDQIGFVWVGQTADQDTRGVAVTMFAPPLLEAEIAPPSATVAAATDFSLAEIFPDATIPPVFDPNFIPEPPDLNVRSAGPDFGFIGFQATGWTPPDPDIAAGPNHVVVVVNGGIRFFTHGGSQLFSQAIAGSNGFWGQQGAGGFVFDPIAVYDHHANRFVVAAAEQTGPNAYLLLAVSDDDNPVGTWAKYRFNVTSFGGDFIDFPNLGIDSQAYYITGDFFSSPGGNYCFIIDKAPTLVGAPVTPVGVQMSNGFLSLGTVNNYDAPSNVQYFATSYGSGGRVRIYAIRDPLTNPQVSFFTFTSPTFGQPPKAPQLGTSNLADTIDFRIKNGVYRNGALWISHTIGQSNTARVRWYEIRTNGWPLGGTPTIHQYGTINPGTGIFTYMPDIGVDDGGNALLAFNRSSANEYISIQRTYRLATDSLTTMRPPETMQTSTSPEQGSRWGDYSGVDEQPNAPGVFWTHLEYRTSNWRTWVGRVNVPVCPGPPIVQQPADTVGCLGESASFTVTTSNPGASFQWRIGDVDLVDDGRIVGAGTATLTIHDLTAADAAPGYNCVLSEGACFTVSLEAELQVTPAAEFLVQPADANIPEGAALQLNALVQGYPNYTFQWRKDGQPLFNDGRITGATTQALQINPSQASDSGLYDCVATHIGSACATASNAADVTVVGASPDCPEDLDGDGVVGLSDLSVLLTNFGLAGGPADGDITGDGVIDLADLSALLTAFGTECP